MEKQFLLDGETVTQMSDDGSVILTNLRMLKNEYFTGKSHFASIALKNISSIEVHSKSTPWLLYLGIIIGVGTCLFGASRQSFEPIVTGIVLAAILIGVYLLTRYHAVTVSSNGGAAIHFRTRGMTRETVLEFVTKIDDARALTNRMTR